MTPQYNIIIIRCLAVLLCLAVIGRATATASDQESFDVDAVVGLLELVIDADTDAAGKCLTVLAEKVQSGEVSPQQRKVLRARLEETLTGILRGKADHPLRADAGILAASWNDPAGVGVARELFDATTAPSERRLAALAALIAAPDPGVLESASRVLRDGQSNDKAFRAATLAALGRMDQAGVADVVLRSYGEMEADLRPRAIELLTQRPAWSKRLLDAIGRGQVPAAALNVNQVGKLLASRDPDLVRLVKSKWGSVRTERNPQREEVISQMSSLLRQSTGDPQRGQQIFDKVCGQCHKIHGQGQNVGPDITDNGRASFDQLLSNVFDPSLVIGASYQARTVVTLDGRVLTGLLAEDNERRLVLKVQGGKLETIPRDNIDEMQVSKLSLMPEGLEKQLKPGELTDLFAFLTLDRPPDDPQAKRIPGAP